MGCAARGRLRTFLSLLILLSATSYGLSAEDDQQPKEAKPAGMAESKQVQKEMVDHVIAWTQSVIKEEATWAATDKAMFCQVVTGVAPFATPEQKDQLLKEITAHANTVWPSVTLAQMTPFTAAYRALATGGDALATAEWMQHAEAQWKSLTPDNLVRLFTWLRQHKGPQCVAARTEVMGLIYKSLSDEAYRAKTPKSTIYSIITTDGVTAALTPQQKAALRQGLINQFADNRETAATLSRQDISKLYASIQGLGGTPLEAEALVTAWLKASDQWKQEAPGSLVTILSLLVVDRAARGEVENYLGDKFLKNDEYLKKACADETIHDLVTAVHQYVSADTKSDLLTRLTVHVGPTVPGMKYPQLIVWRRSLKYLNDDGTRTAAAAVRWSQANGEQWKKCTPSELIELILMLDKDPYAKARAAVQGGSPIDRAQAVASFANDGSNRGS